MMKRFAALLMAAVLLVSMTAFASAEGKTLRFATGTEPTSLDPQLGNGTWITNVTGAIFESLLRRYNGEILPGVAESYEVSEDGTVYTFHLRDCSWTDGTPITAQTFVDSWNLLIERATPMSQFTDFFTITDESGKNVANAVALDEKTLQCTLNYNVPFMAELFANSALGPVRTDLYAQYGDAYYQSVPQAMNGPFVLKDWFANDQMVLVPNEQYWNADKVNFDTVYIYTVTDTTTQANMYESGELDLLTVPNTMYAEFESKGMEYYEDGSTYFLQFTTDGSTDETVPFLANRDFIEAVSYCIDRENYVASIYGTAYSPSVEFIPGSSTGYAAGTKAASNVTIDTPYALKADYDVAQAKLDSALATLGVSAEAMPSFTLVVNDNAATQTAAQYLQDACSMVGINLVIDTIPRTTYWSTLRAGYRYDFALCGSGPDVNDASTFFDVYDGEGKYADTFMRWHSDEYAQMLEESWNVPSVEERSELLVKMENYLLANGPIIPLYHTRAGWMLRDGFTNINRNMCGADLDFVFGDVQ